MRKGDRVAVIDDDMNGIITKVLQEKITVLTEDNFEIDFSMADLVLIDDNLAELDYKPDNISKVLSEKEDARPKKPKRVRSKDRTPPMEVDLHIHQLVPRSKGLSNHEMLTIQVDTAKRQLDFAISKRIQRVVFIHGIGAGVLRAELEYLFRRYENIQVNDANFKKYGRGATEVYIFQKKKIS